MQLRKALAQYVSTSSFMRPENGNMSKSHDPDSMAPGTQSRDPDSLVPSLFVIPTKNKDDSPGDQYESYTSMLWKLRDKVSLSLSLSGNLDAFHNTSCKNISSLYSGFVHEFSSFWKNCE